MSGNVGVGAGISALASTATIANNVVSGLCWGVGIEASTVDLTNNTLVNNCTGVSLVSNSSLSISNNIIAFNTYCGFDMYVLVWSPPPGYTIPQCTITLSHNCVASNGFGSDYGCGMPGHWTLPPGPTDLLPTQTRYSSTVPATITSSRARPASMPATTARLKGPRTRTACPGGPRSIPPASAPPLST